MEKSNIKLTTAEIATLWKTYIHNTAVRCFYKHFLQHLQDVEIKSIIEEVVVLVETVIGKIEAIFEKENFPIPKGFSDKDIDLSAPALYTDLFALSFVYRGGQIIIPHYANVLQKVTRIDLYTFFAECLYSETELHKKSLNLMLSKGLNDRPPNMEYPKSVEFIQHQPSLINTWLGEKRPLNTLEITELFVGIERNAIGLIFLMGLIQVTKDKEIKDHLLKGKKLAEKKMDIYDKLLRENDHLIGFPVPMEVTNSTISPFSERLILFIISAISQISVSALGDSLSVSMRKDLAAHFSLLVAEVMKYGNEGLKILIERGWMEKPPQPIDRNKFYKS
ncbi:DUF3231 family protein [Priestia aryabhattai]|jgi:hypothetical protein|uniref:DUF3231 family protein n=1 Tax=Priestia TaxID=2800373 RepID=UPI001C8E1FD4|nr:DUF3231 family protein [Priestia aryabhattai]MBY0030784.1 DUF3231 family protein [Priestia aryabhattai]